MPPNQQQVAGCFRPPSRVKANRNRLRRATRGSGKLQLATDEQSSSRHNQGANEEAKKIESAKTRSYSKSKLPSTSTLNNNNYYKQAFKMLLFTCLVYQLTASCAQIINANAQQLISANTQVNSRANSGQQQLPSSTGRKVDRRAQGWTNEAGHLAAGNASRSTLAADRQFTKSRRPPGRRRRRIARSPVRSTRIRSQANQQSQPQPAATSAARATLGTSTIQAFVGQRLTIPCSNLTLAASEQVGRSTYSNNRQQQQQQQQQQRPPSADTQLLAAAQRQRPTNLANGQGISLIVWHKDDQLDSPIFSIDARGVSSLKEAKQQTGAETLKGRAHLEESTRVDGRGLGSTPALVIDEAGPQDGGVYTCTVEFHKAPTQTHEIRVSLITPPRNMVILEETNNNQRHLSSSPGGFVTALAGPYDEDSSLLLTCQADFDEAASANAQITWWQLSSISGLPGTSNSVILLPAATLDAPALQQQTQKLPDPARAEQQFQNADYLTTVGVVQSSAANSMEPLDQAANPNNYRSPTVRDYFVGLNSNSNPLERQAGLIIPVPDGHHLKHWTRVKSEQQRSLRAPADTKLQASVQLLLSRSYLDNEFLCLATNNDFSAPLNSTVKINLNLKPAEVRIVHKSDYTFKLGQKLVIECQVYGSKPTPTVRWFRGFQQIDTNSQHALKDSPDDATLQLGGDHSRGQSDISEFNRDINNNLTKISYLTLIPRLSDNQKSLVCSAQNPQLPNSEAISDSITMNVQFAAQLNLQFGTNIKEDSIKLGSDVFMDCNIQANPPINELIWLFNDQPLAANVTKGIIISNQSLVLQRIKIENRGSYQCAARNAIGYSRSNKLTMKPKFAPVCDYGRTKTKYEVTINQSVKIDCFVVSEPSDDLNFVWRFNQTSGDFGTTYHSDEIKHYETNFSQSQVTFTPKTRRHYGQFLCSASNSFGKQEKPCVIQVILSELPDPVFGCFFDNLSNSSFSVHCQTKPSSSGRQNYLLELYANESSSGASEKQSTAAAAATTIPTNESGLRDLSQDDEDGQQSDDDEHHHDNHLQQQQHQQQVKKLTSETPSFEVSELKADTSYNLMIYVINSKGRSSAAFYQANTLPANIDSNSNQEAQSSGQIQFFNKRPIESAAAAASTSLTERLNFYLRSGGDFLSFSNLKPLTSILLVLLLCSAVVVIITLFVTRVCRPHGSGQLGNRKRRQKSRTSIVVPAERLTGEKLSVYERGEPVLDRTVQLTPASKARMAALAGNGSDTSRETNTDSTMISGGNTGQASSGTDDKQQAHHEQQMSKIKSKRESYLREMSNQQEVIPASLAMQMLVHKTGNIGGRAGAGDGGDGQARSMHSLYSQVSLQSGSDCTSNNELQGDHSEYHDQVLVACHDNISEPVYVISRNGIHNQQLGEHQSQQLHILDPSDLWHYRKSIGDNNGGSLSGTTQVSSSITTTADSDQPTITADSIQGNNVCRLVGDMQGGACGEAPPLPIGLLPSSLSIPVSLSDCLHFGPANEPYRHLSQQDFFGTTAEPQQAAFCIANTNGSYLALAPEVNRTRCSQSPYSTCCEQKSAELAGSSPFASYHRQQRCKQANGHLDELHCSQTMDSSCRGPRRYPNGTKEQILQRARRSPLIEKFANQQQQQDNHVKSNQHGHLSDQFSYQ